MITIVFVEPHGFREEFINKILALRTLMNLDPSEKEFYIDIINL